MPPEYPHIDNLAPFRVRSTLVAVFTIVMALALGYGAFLMLKGAPAAEVATRDTEQEVIGADTAEELGGNIYLSLAPSETADAFALDIYRFDPTTAVLTQQTDAEYREFLTSEMSPDGTMMAYASLSNDGVERTSDTALFIQDVVAGDATEVETIDPAPQKRTPTWSHDSAALAFVARLDRDVDPMIPESWTLYTYAVGTDEYAERVASGANPVYLPDGSIVVLRSDGIHRVDVATGDSTHVIPYTEKLEVNTKFDISRDGKRIAISEPSQGIVRVIPITSWAPFVSGEEMVISAHAFWPTFSPGGDFLAMQTFEWSDETDAAFPTNPALAVYSLKENVWLSVYDLRKFVQEALFITDWK